MASALGPAFVLDAGGRLGGEGDRQVEGGRSGRRLSSCCFLQSPASVLNFLDLNSSSDKHENLRNTQDGRLLSRRWSRFSSLEVFRGELSAARVSLQEPDPAQMKLKQQIVLPGLCFIVVLRRDSSAA